MSSGKKSDIKFVASGFTLLEVILAMILTGIVIAMAYYVIFFAQKEWSVFQEDHESINSILIFRQAIEADIEKAVLIQSLDKEIVSLFLEGDTIRYFLGNQTIRIKAKHADTFEIKVQNLSFTYIESLKNTGIVNRIRFDVVDPIHIAGFTIDKHYTSSELMNNTQLLR